MKVEKQTLITLVIQVLLVLVIGFSLYVYLQEFQKYTFFYREQHQLFLWDADAIQKMILPIGGGVKALSQIMVQFFVLPHVGALVSVLLTLMGAHFLWLGVKKVAGAWWLFPLAFVPFFLYNIYLTDHYVHYDGLVALVLWSVFFWLHTLLSGVKDVLRVGIDVVSGSLLFYVAGSVAVLFGICVLIYELVRIPGKAVLFCFPLLVVLGLGLLAVNQAWITDFGHAFWMPFYVEYYVESTPFYSLAWLSVPVLILIAWSIGKLNIKKIWVQGSLALMLAVVLAFVYSSVSGAHQDMGRYNVERIQHLADVEQWDEIIALGNSETNNYITLNYLNLALCEKGELLEQMFRFSQNSSQAVFLDYQQYTDIGILRARQYYLMGAIAASQMNAVSAKMSVADGCPSMSKLVIKNYLITRRYKIAEKYIRELEQTWYYADWATSMRRYLNNDKAVEADSELGVKRKDLPLDNEYFTIYAGIYNDTQTVLSANPDEKHAADYALACMLLDQKFDYILPFTEYNYGKGCLKTLPERLQEAILAVSEHDMEMPRRYGISEEKIAQFAQFRKDALALRHSGGSVTRLAGQYGGTYWYYMLKNSKKK